MRTQRPRIQGLSARLRVILLLAVAMPQCFAAPAFGDPIPEPEAVYYGQVLNNNTPLTEVTVLLKLGAVTLDQYSIGSNPAAGTYYVVRARLFDPITQNDVRPPGSAFIGDTVALYLQGETTPWQQFQIDDRGTITRV